MRAAPKLQSLHLPPLRLCRLAVFSIKPILLLIIINIFSKRPERERARVLTRNFTQRTQSHREPPTRPNWALWANIGTPTPQTNKGRQGGQRKEEAPNRRRGAGKRGRTIRGSAAARPTLTRDWWGPQVRDPMPIVSVNPGAAPPHPRAPRLNWALYGAEGRRRGDHGG